MPPTTESEPKYDLLSPQFFADPHPVFRRMREQDPAQFADPERFDITRSDNNHLGLGYGPHFCVGAPIARLETGIALTTLVQRLPGLGLATTSIERLPNLAIRGVRALPVTFTP